MPEELAKCLITGSGVIPHSWNPMIPLQIASGTRANKKSRRKKFTLLDFVRLQYLNIRSR
jgi:hypothetical protein